jgi:fucose permease
MQKVMGLDALGTGIGLLPLSIALLVVSLLIPRFSKRFYPKHIIMVAMLVMAAGAFIMAVFTPANPTRVDLILGLAVLGAGAGLLAGTIPNVVISSVPQEAVNEAAGLNNSTDQIGGALGTALIGAILIASLSWGASGLVLKSEVLSAETKKEVVSVVEKDMQIVSSDELEKILVELPEDVRNELVRLYETATTNAFGITALAIAIFALLGFGVALFLPKKKLE